MQKEFPTPIMVTKVTTCFSNFSLTYTANCSYSKSAKRMRSMVQNKPCKPEELLVRWTEYLAEFKELPNLTPYSTKLNFFEYYSIDIVLVLTTAVLVILFATLKILRLVTTKLRRLLSLKKRKTD